MRAAALLIQKGRSLAFHMPPRPIVSRAVLGLLLVLSAFGADNSFRLGTDYTEWLYPNAGLNASQLATDRAGAVYILSIIPGTSLSNPPKFLVTKTSSDGRTILWENSLGFGVTS